MRKYSKATELFRQEEYFESLEALTETLEMYEFMDFNQGMEKKSPSIFNLFKDCYKLSAQCYYKIN